ncbi:hypothetical protein MHK_008413 [Candidatus Magnetomorum sp. HK-1]|nr:hypothetical protein MHK_008413 [Candidatus Magnetomorum sp. HK-1]
MTVDEMNFIGSICSVFGLIASIIVMIHSIFVKKEVQKLKTLYLFNKRCQQHLKKIDRFLSKLNELIKDYENSGEDIENTLVKCKAELLSLSEKVVDRRNTKQLKKAIGIIAMIEKRGLTCRHSGFLCRSPFRADKNTVWQAYQNIQLIYSSVDNLAMDSKGVIYEKEYQKN